MGINELLEKFYYTLQTKKKIVLSEASDLYECTKKCTMEDRKKYADGIASKIGYNIIVDIFLWSFVLYIYPDKQYMISLEQLILDDKELNWRQINYLYNRISCMIFMNPSLKSTDTISLNWKISEKVNKMCKEELSVSLDKIPMEERNQNLVIVLTDQYLTIQHGPTKTALDRCYVLKKIFRKNVFLINSGETLTQVGQVPFFKTMVGNYNEDLLDTDTVSWKGESFSFYQCDYIMPEVEELTNLINAVKKLKPCMVVSVGGTDVLSGLINEMIPVVTVGLTQSGLVTTLTDYQVVEQRMTKEVIPILEKMGKDISHIIEGRFTFSLKPQTEHLIRADVGLEEDNFVISVVGGRLTDEITDEFLEMLEHITEKYSNVKIAIIGVCEDIDKKIKKHPKVGENIEYLGFCKDILSRLELCDLYVNPIRTGGGTSAVEAMFMGKPPITVNYGDVAGIVGQDFICDSYNEMEKIIEKYITDKEFYDMKSKNAKELSKELLDSENEFVRIINEYLKRAN